MSEDWSPWKVQRVLPPSAAIEEARRQKQHVDELLGTTLPPMFRTALRRFEEELAIEISNDNGQRT